MGPTNEKIRNDASAQRAAEQAVWAALVENVSEAICGINAKGEIATWNHGATCTFGYQRDDALGRPMADLLTGESSSLLHTSLNEALQGKPLKNIELSCLCKLGATIVASFSFTAVENARDGVHIVTVIRDVTEARRVLEELRSSSQHTRSLIEASLDPLVTISPDGKITDVNEATTKVTGVPRDKLIGTDFSDYFCEPQKAREGYQQVFLKGAVTDYPLTIRHKNGQQFDVLYNASIYRDTKGSVLGVFAAAREVTAQKEASQYARSLLEASLDPLVTISPEGKITDVNEATIKVTGLQRQKLLGTDFSDYFTEPDKAREGYQQVFAKGFVTDYPLTIRHRRGRLTDVLYNASVYRDSRGRVQGVFAAARDVTAQKEASQYSRSLIEASVDPLVTISPMGIITDVNDATIKVTGVPRDKLIGTDFSDYFVEPEKAREGYQQVFAQGFVTDYALTIRHRDGKLTDVLYNASVYRDSRGKVLGVFAAARDVTAQKQVSQYARSLIEASLDPLVTISPAGKITDVNEASAQVTGVNREKLIGTDFSDYFTEPEKAREGYKQVFQRGAVSDYPLTIRHKNGSLTDVLYNASVYKDSRGTVLGVFASARDVTAQKQASQYARSLIEASLDPLVTISSTGKITDVNEATIRATGVLREKLIGADFSIYFTQPDEAREGYQQVFSKGFVTDYPLTIRHRDGRCTSVLYNASVYKDVRGNVLGVFAAARDVTAQKQAEAEVAEQRTKELERLSELERFQKLTVGRELKMIELKKEIDDLRRRIQ